MKQLRRNKSGGHPQKKRSSSDKAICTPAIQTSEEREATNLSPQLLAQKRSLQSLSDMIGGTAESTNDAKRPKLLPSANSTGQESEDDDSDDSDFERAESDNDVSDDTSSDDGEDDDNDEVGSDSSRSNNGDSDAEDTTSNPLSKPELPKDDLESAQLAVSGDNLPAGIQWRDPETIPPGVALSDLSPSSRIALRRKRRKRLSAFQRMGNQMLRQSAREHHDMMQALTGTTDRFFEEMRVSWEQEKEWTNALCSLLREAIAAVKDMPTLSQHSQELSHTLVAPRPAEFPVDLQMPSTSRATHHGCMGGEGPRDWPPAHMTPTPPPNRIWNTKEEQMGGWIANPVGLQGYGVDTTVLPGPCFDFPKYAMHVEALSPVMDPLPTMHAPRVSERHNGDMDVPAGGSGRAQSTPANKRSKHVIKPKKIFSPGD